MQPYPDRDKEDQERCLEKARAEAFHTAQEAKQAFFDLLISDWKVKKQGVLKTASGAAATTATTRISEMRAELNTHFLDYDHGRWRFEIPRENDQHKVHLELKERPRTRAASPLAPKVEEPVKMAFWSPFLTELDFVYPEVHFFFQRERRMFIRFQDYNGPEDAIGGDELSPLLVDTPGAVDFDNSLQRIVQKNGAFLNIRHSKYAEFRVSGDVSTDEQVEPLQDVQNFVTLGHMKFILRVQSCLRDLGGEAAQTNPAHEAHPSSRHNKNIVVLGNSRTNPFVREMVGITSKRGKAELPYRIGPNWIRNLLPRTSAPRNKTLWFDYEQVAEDPDLSSVYALLTRMRCKTGGESLVIAANHGAAYTALANYLIQEAHLVQLSKALKLEKPFEGSFPKRFQVLFSVDIDGEKIPGTKNLILPRLIECHVRDESTTK